MTLWPQVVQYIKDGNVLECPENTPKSVYKLMTMCWSGSPANRPCFRSNQWIIPASPLINVILQSLTLWLLQDPAPRAGYNRGGDCLDTEAHAVAEINASVAKIFRVTWRTWRTNHTWLCPESKSSVWTFCTKQTKSNLSILASLVSIIGLQPLSINQTKASIFLVFCTSRDPNM